MMSRTPAPTAIPAIAPVPSITPETAPLVADVDADVAVDEVADEDVGDVEDGSDVEAVGLADEEDVCWPSQYFNIIPIDDSVSDY